ncbi:MAG: Type 1 glutamine amidotransferase-like domain-containing protein [Saprospiraceae bacterium]|nr:Type 1 glutamine amidotransferase-like domain-containing protein [Saprospiraceae bacterium]
MRFCIPFIISTLFFSTQLLLAQTYTSYPTGSSSDTLTNPQGGVCLMGGATENDDAMRWFLERADSGDVLVLRASGSDGYNDYFYNQLGVGINSVTTIIFNNSSANQETYIHQKIQNAEAIWFAGGDQWDYISYWRNSPIDSLIRDAIQNRNIVIGGTSAGMAILGQFIFTAQNGTITSNTALNNPYDADLTIDSSQFLAIPFLQKTITDTHYDNPDRKGRQVTFMARAALDWNLDEVRGIACDEYTAVCVDTNGLARVFGDHPNFDDNAYFLQINCEADSLFPEVCSNNTALTWDRNGQAIKVYAVKGTSTGTNSFDLATWKSGSGGTWQEWSIDQGTLTATNSDSLDCSPVQTSTLETTDDRIFRIFPNPNQGQDLWVESDEMILKIRLYNQQGLLLKEVNNSPYLSLKSLPAAIYFIQVQTAKQEYTSKLIRY